MAVVSSIHHNGGIPLVVSKSIRLIVHRELMAEKKAKETANLRNEREWHELEANVELSCELDEAFEYLDNLGPEGNYLFEPEFSLVQLDENDALDKLNIMEKLHVAGFAPGAATFTILINASIAENDIDKAFETFNLMRSHVADPDVVAFTSMINGFATIGRVEKAMNLFEDLLESGLTPSHVTFNTLINACAKSHYYAHKAIEFYNEMQELYDYYPDLTTYNTVLHACAKQGDVVQAEVILRHMKKHQVPMDEWLYNQILNGETRFNTALRRIVFFASCPVTLVVSMRPFSKMRSSGTTT